MTPEEGLQEKFAQFKMLQEHIEKLSEQLQQIHLHVEEITFSQDSIKELKEAPLSSEVLCPIANGIFIKALLNEKKSLIVNVGADTMVEKTFDRVVEMLEQQKNEFHDKMKEGEAMLQQMHIQAMKIYQELEKLE
ncbi:prefoldin subunit alpha [Candidatus Woesearchaeota archaeon]|nr:prefoldin subunit alpha [Candidatus Woesearchaeota archaeon]